MGKKVSRGTRASAKKPGRPTSLTPDVQESIVTMMREGSFLEHAARLSGVHPSTVFRWLQRGEEEGAKDPFKTFAEEFRKAEAQAENDAKELLRRAGAVEWRAALAFLERRFPDRWGEKTRQHLTLEGEPVKIYLPDNGRDSS